MPKQTSGVSSPNQNEEHLKYIYSYKHFNFRGTAPRSPDINPIDFYLCGHWKPLSYLALTEHNTRFMQVKPSENTPGSLKECDSSCSDVSTSTWTQEGDTLSTWWGLWLDIQ
jgi:hypothetical protein